uniref:Uncharacterized protein n=1 Tax=Arundo donax TaxID=35708 RepID=A0A0A9BPE8_ARUDO
MCKASSSFSTKIPRGFTELSFDTVRAK